MTPTRPVIIYDGSCIMCSKLAHVVVARDDGQYLFVDSSDLRISEWFPDALLDTDDTIYLIDQHGKWYSESEAIVEVLNTLHGIYPTIAKIIGVLPKYIADGLYRWVSINRKRFQNKDRCPAMRPELAARMKS